MARLAERVMYSVLGACSGLGWLVAASKCSGNGCNACYGCVGAGSLIVVLAALKHIKKNRKGGDSHGMAETGH